MNPDTRKAELESVIPSFLPGQRWFGGKARRVQGVRIVDWAELPCGPVPVYLFLIDVEFAEGPADLYFLPLALVTGPAPAHTLARLSESTVLCDALADTNVCAALLEAIAAGQAFSTQSGVIRTLTTTAFAALRGDPATPVPALLAPPTSSNSLVLYGKRLLLKLFRRLEIGINPDFEIGRFLTEKHAFPRVPKTAGALEYHRPGMGLVTLALLQELVPNQGDGWRHALSELSRYFERVSASLPAPDVLKPDERSLLELAQSDPPPAALEAIGPYLQAVATLGQRTAELHLALASDPHEPAFAPEPLTPADLAALAAALHAQARTALDTLRTNLDRLPESITPEARRFLEEGPKQQGHFGRQLTLRTSVAKIRCHGDYHLGQVLWVDGDFILLDFEGEPTRTVEERRAKQSPLKDLAGMLRSFDYAAYAGLFAFLQNHPGDFERLEPWANLWQKWTSAVFMREYLATAAGASFLPTEPADFLALLQVFMLDKSFYELVYELNNRPDWVRIPLRGILKSLK